MRPSDAPVVRLVLFGVFTAAVSVSADVTVYVKVGEDVILKPSANSVTEPIKQILWKEGVNKAMEWDGSNSSVEYFRHFKDRGHLSTTTGEMTILKSTHNDTNRYTPEINNIRLPPVHLVVLSPVPSPTASASCDESTCKLTCDGNTTGAGTVTYTWMLDNVVHVSSENQYTVHKHSWDNRSSSIDFSCAMKNPISEQRSDPVPISFTPPPEKGPKISTGVTVLIVLVCVVLLLVAVHRWKAGTWFFEKDSMPWEADFWRKSESRRREAPASNGNPSHQRGKNAEEESMTAS